MKKFYALMLAATMTFSLSACVNSELSSNNEVDDSNQTNEQVEVKDLEIADSLNINFAMGNNARTMTYQQANPLTLPDGTIVTQGDLKPTWQYIEKQLGFTINDNTVQDQKATEMIDLEAATGFKDDTIYGGNSIANDLMNYGAQGYFINLKDYLDYMPNVKEYLEENPNVASAITAYDGGIYHLPYVAEIDNYARTFNGRNEWVTALLDSTDALETESETLNVAYNGYWDRNDTNVATLQNEAATNGVIDRDTALNVLIDYINTTYPDLEKPSDLYVGETAVYDIDELVALWRVIELSPNTLSKVTTGAVVDGAEVSPFFVRKSKYREDVLRLITYFDGEKVHSSDSYGATLYVDENGEMVYSYDDEDFLEKLDYIKAMYSEGLLHSEFADLSVTDEFRKSMYFADDAEGQKQFGFMTFDWIASTTASNEAIDVFLPPVTTISGAGIDDFVHYVENTRAIKPDGWAISAAADEVDINTALTLFDYMFSEEGNLVQNYSIPDAWVEGEKFVGPDGTEYPKFNDWILDTAGEMKDGDISGFLRDFMGSHLALGYQKEIGFELQYTSENGFDGWDLYTKADVLSMSYGADNDYLRLMPPIISLNDQEVAKIDTVAIGTDQTDQLFLYITGADAAADSVDGIEDIFDKAGIKEYLEVYQTAYDRMMQK
ncbi:type 2 periplasmic-binding domain-containing protein [Clostridium sp. DL1XJH146]